jgi:hypothetical protein
MAEESKHNVMQDMKIDEHALLLKNQHKPYYCPLLR